MAFNLATAKPVEDPSDAAPAPAKKFNLATAKPVTGNDAPPVDDGLIGTVKRALDPVLAGPDLLATAASGAVGDTVGNLAGLGAMATDAVGTLFGKKPGETADPEAVKNKVSGAITWAPKTELAKKVVDVAAKPFQYLDEKKGETADIARKNFGDTAGDIVQGGLNAAQATLEYLPGVKGAKAAEAAARGRLKTPPKLSEAVKAGPGLQANRPEEVARSLGLKVRPSDVEVNPNAPRPGAVARAAEAVSDRAGLSRDFSIDNAAKINSAAAKDISLPDGVELNAKSLGTLRKPHEGIYDAVSELPQTVTSPEYSTALKALEGQRGADPKVQDAIAALKTEFATPGAPKDMLASIKALRDRARKQIQADDVVANETGYANKRMAGLLEDELERVAVASGNTSLLKDFRGARRELAKIHTVEDSLVAGHVDANLLKKARDKGAALDGRLAAIAEAAEFFPEVTKHPHTTLKAQAQNLPTTVADMARKAVGKLGPEQYLKKGYQNSVFPEGDAALGKYFGGAKEKPLPPGASEPNPFGGPEGPQAADLRAQAQQAGDKSLAAELRGDSPGPLPGEPIEWDQRAGGSAPVRRQTAQGADPQPGWDYLNPDAQLEVPGAPPVGAGSFDDLMRELQLGAPDELGFFDAPPPPQSWDEALASVFGPAEGPALPKDLGPMAPAAPDFDIGGLSLADDVAPPRAQADFLDEPIAQPRLAVLPQGQKRDVQLYRGVGPGRDPKAREGTLGNALFYTPDEATAQMYGAGGQVLNETVPFQNLLDADTLAQVREYLGLDPRAELTDIIAAARQNKYDGVTYDLKPGREYVDLRE